MATTLGMAISRLTPGLPIHKRCSTFSGLNPDRASTKSDAERARFACPSNKAGLAVAGSDYSSTLVVAASKALADGEFECCEASKVPAFPQYDFVVASGVFIYFPDLEYAGTVIRAMVAKARRGIAILDNPDLARKEETLALRYQVAGSKEEYEKRYQGLDHLYFDRNWFARQLESAGATSVLIRDQEIQDHGNAAGRFNVFARLRQTCP